ncbi:hypothetical protein QYF36_009569 [Acer negundo]|nr:hypothetical protein QYF36_009569 [Acer negundo]
MLGNSWRHYLKILNGGIFLPNGIGQYKYLRDGGFYEVRDDVDVTSALVSLNKKVEALALCQRMNTTNNVRSERTLCCNLCKLPSKLSCRLKLKVIGEREKGKLSSQPVLNPKGQYEIGLSHVSNVHHEEVKSVTTIRSVEKPISRESLKPDLPVAPYVPRAHFPQRLVPLQKGTPHNDILEVFKQVCINIPFLDAIQQVPAYAKI